MNSIGEDCENLIYKYKHNLEFKEILYQIRNYNIYTGKLWPYGRLKNTGFFKDLYNQKPEYNFSVEFPAGAENIKIGL